MAAWNVLLDVLGRIVVERAAGFRVEARRPGEFVDILLAGDERAVGAVERIEEAVARGMHDELAVLAVDFGVDDRVFGYFVVIVWIVRCVLVAPFDLAVGGRDRGHTCRPFVISRPVFRVPVRARIADALIDGVGIGIVGGGFPDRCAAMAPAFLAVLPGLVAGLAG